MQNWLKCKDWKPKKSVFMKNQKEESYNIRSKRNKIFYHTRRWFLEILPSNTSASLEEMWSKDLKIKVFSEILFRCLYTINCFLGSTQMSNKNSSNNTTSKLNWKNYVKTSFMRIMIYTRRVMISKWRRENKSDRTRDKSKRNSKKREKERDWRS